MTPDWPAIGVWGIVVMLAVIAVILAVIAYELGGNWDNEP